MDDKASSIADTPGLGNRAQSRVKGIAQGKPRTWPHCTVPSASTHTDLSLDPLVTTDEKISKSSQAPVTECSEQTDEENHSISIGPTAGADSA